ncbi:MAG: hypothetical protein QOH57_367 [Mycobacterium sp.]|jgi:hypothetical protein|nr:hypothetical protein [Mycobacterium sp.]
MRRPRSTARTVTAVLTSTVLVAACVARAESSPTVRRSPAPAAVALATTAPVFDDPVAPEVAFDGLDARVKQATSAAADAGAAISVDVMDRNTGQTVSNGNNTALPIASVAKLFIADDLLLQVAKGQTQLSPSDRHALDVMLQSSDDSAAQVFWDRSGGSAIISRVVARYGLTGTTAPYNGHWDLTLSTASDLVRYYDMLLDGSGGLPAEQANAIVSNLAQSTPTGADGYPQRFGIPDGLYAEPVAVKQGWFCCWNGGNQLHMSTGAIGSDHRFVMVIGALQPTSDSVARNTLTQAVKTMFPAGRI